MLVDAGFVLLSFYSLSPSPTDNLTLPSPSPSLPPTLQRQDY